MKVSLMVLSTGAAEGKALPINTGQFIIGRDPQCNLRPASAMISKRHCAVLVKGGQVFVRDFDSTNGTFVNEQPIKGEVILKDGDVLKVGPLSFKAVIEGAPAPTKPTPPPKPKSAQVTDDDAAAALLSIDDGSPENAAAIEADEDAVAAGSTIMEMPIYTPAGEAHKDAPAQAPAEEKKPEAKKKPATGAAQNAAQAILDKLRQGKRK
jgi:pSer/pThr/pTyr-binding forkhead associated (FHA) protein